MGCVLGGPAITDAMQLAFAAREAGKPTIRSRFAMNCATRPLQYQAEVCCLAADSMGNSDIELQLDMGQLFPAAATRVRALSLLRVHRSIAYRVR